MKLALILAALAALTATVHAQDSDYHAPTIEQCRLDYVRWRGDIPAEGSDWNKTIDLAKLNLLSENELSGRVMQMSACAIVSDATNQKLDYSKLATVYQYAHSMRIYHFIKRNGLGERFKSENLQAGVDAYYKFLERNTDLLARFLAEDERGER